MVVHQIFAHILDTQIKNIIVCDNYEVANQLARAIYGQNAIAVECTQYPCSIGDFYVDNSFHYKDKEDPSKVGDLIPRKNTAEEDALEANNKATLIQNIIAENIVDIEVLKALAGIDGVATDDNNEEKTDYKEASDETLNSESESLNESDPAHE